MTPVFAELIALTTPAGVSDLTLMVVVVGAFTAVHQPLELSLNGYSGPVSRGSSNSSCSLVSKLKPIAAFSDTVNFKLSISMAALNSCNLLSNTCIVALSTETDVVPSEQQE